jgi:hypothetical protein
LNLFQSHAINHSIDVGFNEGIAVDVSHW